MRQQLSLKPAHKVVQDFYKEIDNLSQLNLFHEGAVSPAFANLLKRCASQFGWTLSEQHMPKGGKTSLRFDGALLDEFKLVHGVWEAKDTKDDLSVEAAKKFKVGYPKENILFQSPGRAILFQNGQQVFDADIRKPEQLVAILELFFEYEPPAYEQWNEAVEEFKLRIHEYGESALAIIQQERKTNKRFVQAFSDFMEVCRAAVNPNLSAQAVEEMLIQHLLTERLFRKVFNNPDFVRRNAIASEIEKVIDALTSQSFSRAQFLQRLDRFYGAIEATAETIDDFSEKQAFLNVVYEKFFQGFSVKVADTHGIVYTPQPIVDFMVRSVEEILRREFGRSLSDEGVHVLDPFTGTGNFIVRIMREMKKSALPHKFGAELHCNEVMLLPYYIASQNIEHAYFELTGDYQPFENLCLVDTFQLAEGAQMAMSFVAAGNSERVKRQQEAPIFVIIGNPPYNAHQINENDNSKNRKYPELDKWVAQTYAKDSAATNKNALSDPYVKAYKWASKRIEENGEGIVAFVSNNSFINDFSFDGMRKHLAADFNRAYVLDLKGNIRKDSMRDGIPLGEQHTVFGLSAMVGIAITFLVRKKDDSEHKVFYKTVDFRSTRAEKFSLLEKAQVAGNLDWQELKPDNRFTWMTEGLQDDFETFMPMGSKEAKSGKGNAIFNLFSGGVKTNRDAWAYNFSADEVKTNIKRMLDVYNEHVLRWGRSFQKASINDFVLSDDEKISWSEGLKNGIERQLYLEFEEQNVRPALYRPFVSHSVYFSPIVTERRYQFPDIFPKLETENLVIWLKVGSEWPMFALMTDKISDVLPQGGSQCFPFYIYDEDGSNRRENISDWALAQFNDHYVVGATRPGLTGAPSSQETGHNGATSGLDGSPLPISKWDIFHYVYALLHSPAYREKYAANLKRDLPHIPFVDSVEKFWQYVEAGKQLAELHVNYEQQAQYPLEMVENAEAHLDWRVEKMRLSKDKTEIQYNDFLTLRGIPAEAFEYRLGNRSALDWVIDQYRVTEDKRSKIVNDPNDSDDPQYIVRLVRKLVTVSVETVRIVKGL
ncbi:MAG TPA: DNA helicase [Anaerolineae bacterium]|jgi:predicted helicase|nr:DNA helicase [Anaerolineae bacterium]